MNAAVQLAVADDAVFRRKAEQEELRQRIGAGTSFVVHGEGGAGKTFLIQHVIQGSARILYCADSGSGQSVFRALAGELLAKKDPLLHRAWGRSASRVIKTKSTLALRGLVLDALRAGHYWVVLDHLRRTSASLASGVRDMVFYGNATIIGVSRSAHLEDLGFMASLFTLPSERMPIRSFGSEDAAEFAQQVASRAGLHAENLREFLRLVVERSGGLPGGIVAMIKMALFPKYRTGGHIKFAPLYIDFRLAWHAANAY